MLTENVQNKLCLYFPDTVEKGETEEDVLLGKEAILPYLQTLFFEERLIEIQIDQSSRIFFATLWDDSPEPVEEEVDGELHIRESEYQAGSYLQEMTHINISPMEPAMGNIHIHHAKILTLRFYTGTTAVELGTDFHKKVTLKGEHLLRLNFPSVGKILRNHRPFRAKVPQDKELGVVVSPLDEPTASRDYRLVDLSPNGLSFGGKKIPYGFQEGELLNLCLVPSGSEPIEVRGVVRHMAKIRTKEGNLEICGVQFELESRRLEAQLEAFYADLQRVFLRSLNERSAGQHIDFKLF